MYSFSYLEPVCGSMSSSKSCFLTCIQISQEAGQVVWYSHLFQNFPQFIVIHRINKAENESEVAQLYPTLSDPMDCSLPGSSIHGVFQARVLEWGAIAFSVVSRLPLSLFQHCQVIIMTCADIIKIHKYCSELSLCSYKSRLFLLKPYNQLLSDFNTWKD